LAFWSVLPLCSINSNSNNVSWLVGSSALILFKLVSEEKIFQIFFVKIGLLCILVFVKISSWKNSKYKLDIYVFYFKSFSDSCSFPVYHFLNKMYLQFFDFYKPCYFCSSSIDVALLHFFKHGIWCSFIRIENRIHEWFLTRTVNNLK